MTVLTLSALGLTAGCSAAAPASIEVADETTAEATSAISASSAQRVYVGTVDAAGSGVRVALVVETVATTGRPWDKIALFVCGDRNTVTTFTRWFRGPTNAETVSASVDDASTRVVVTAHSASWTTQFAHDGSHARGALTRGDGQVFQWSATAVTGGYAGLYDSKVYDGVAGVIATDLNGDGVYTPGELQGAFRVVINDVEHLQQITPLIQASDIDMLRVTFPAAVNGAVIVRPITP